MGHKHMLYMSVKRNMPTINVVENNGDTDKVLGTRFSDGCRKFESSK